MKPGYQWPASRLGPEEMAILAEAREKTGKPITEVLKNAVHVFKSCIKHFDKEVNHYGSMFGTPSS